MSNKINEIQKVCKELGVECVIISKKDSIDIIDQVFKTFKVLKKSGHLAINSSDAISIPAEKNEYTYSANLDSEPVYIFFDQENNDRNQVVLIEDGRRMGAIMENSFGIEYFITNVNFNYLLAINWYSIEGVGSAVNWMKNLIEEE
ncbi:hypothetical protein [Chryseobacterium artocarpi]|uniref:hypothetical protein n=1 Tax=Chryseobacterium artocarpi TaxID=1414727 RepID=UPI001E548A36|nr:hypothetical protein [Chryseobacterium artocarpi]